MNTLIQLNILFIVKTGKMAMGELSSKFWCRDGSGLIGTTDGMFQPMWPRLKSPLYHMFTFVLVKTGKMAMGEF
jgi:hypothetical protein